MGYARSKHVAESICLAAAQSALSSSRIGVFRLGQLCADTVSGVWNESEGWPMMIATAGLCGALPALAEVSDCLSIRSTHHAMSHAFVICLTLPFHSSFFSFLLVEFVGYR